MADANVTGSTLYVLLREPNSPEAWSAFVDRYAPLIYGWCRKRGVQHADAEDVTQLVLTKLARKLHTYDRAKGSFRGWLRTVTLRAWTDLLESLGRVGRGSGDTGVREQIDSVAARDDFTTALERTFDLELLEEARVRVQVRVAPATWQTFELLAVDGQSGAAVAAQLGITVAAAYMARNRVQKMLREEIQNLEGAGDAGASA